jgi:NhaP-type Na+/H+ or K+/H+ antiporter
VRMLPVALSLIGSGLRLRSVLFLGWFGPRGLATILFALLVLTESELPNEDLIATIAMCAAAFSVLFHGLTAVPGAARYGAVVKRSPADCEEELRPVAEHRTRHGMQDE